MGLHNVSRNIPLPRLVPLTRKKFALVDAEDYEKVMAFNWYAVHKRSGGWYAQRQYRLKGKRKVVQLHRFIMSPPDDMDIDHLDSYGLNNCKDNMEIVTPLVNSQRKVPRKKKKFSCKYIGVAKGHYRHKSNTWVYVANIATKGKQICLGQFLDPKKAAIAYDAAAKKLRGDDTLLNINLFPELKEFA